MAKVPVRERHKEDPKGFHEQLIFFNDDHGILNPKDSVWTPTVVPMPRSKKIAVSMLR
jgi:hypothetical protein